MRLKISHVRPADIGALRSMAMGFMHEFESKLEYPTLDEQEVDNRMVKPNGSLQKGDPGQVAGDVMGAFGGNSLSDLPADVQKALMELVGKGK